MGTLSVDKLVKTSQGAAEFTLPATDGTAGQSMVTDGSGQLSLGEVTAAGIATDAVGSSEIAANAVGTTEVADNAITANKLANSAYEAGDNKIINGQYDVWQRGTTVNVTANANVYYCDMWRHEGYTFTGSVSRQTFTNGQTDVPDNPTYYARLIITTNAAGYQAFVQRIENNPVNRFSGKTLTVSFWIKSASGTLADGTVRAYGKGSLTSGSDNIGAITTSWQKIEYTGTLGNVTGSYYSVGLNISQGTLLTSGVDIANFQVEVGDTATPFEQKTYGQELAACQRYYQLKGMGLIGGIEAGSGTVGVWRTGFTFHPEMRAAPTAGVLSGQITYNRPGILAHASISNVIAWSSGNTSLGVVIGVGNYNTSAGAGGQLGIVSAGGNQFNFDAEL